MHPLLPFTVTPSVESRADSSLRLYPIFFVWAAGGNIPIIRRWLVVACRGRTCRRWFPRASGVVVSRGQAMGTHGWSILMRRNVHRLLSGGGRVVSEEPTPKKKLLLTRRSDAAAGQWFFVDAAPLRSRGRFVITAKSSAVHRTSLERQRY